MLQNSAIQEHNLQHISKRAQCCCCSSEQPPSSHLTAPSTFLTDLCNQSHRIYRQLQRGSQLAITIPNQTLFQGLLKRKYHKAAIIFGAQVAVTTALLFPSGLVKRKTNPQREDPQYRSHGAAQPTLTTGRGQRRPARFCRLKPPDPAGITARPAAQAHTGARGPYRAEVQQVAELLVGADRRHPLLLRVHRPALRSRPAGTEQLCSAGRAQGGRGERAAAFPAARPTLRNFPRARPPPSPRRSPTSRDAHRSTTGPRRIRPPPGEGKQINNRDAAKSAELARD